MPCSAVMRAARVCALAASRVSFLACVRTRRPVLFDGEVAVVERVVERVAARRADGLRAAGLRLAAGLLVVVFVVVLVLVFSAMVAFPPALRFGFSLKILFALFVSGEHMYVNRSPG